MPIFDTAARICYSGSYGDSIMSGSLVEQTVNQFGFTILRSGNRVEIGSHISGSRRGLIENTKDFGDYLLLMSSSASRPENHSPRFLQLISPKNQFYDSFVPDIQEVMNTDAKGITLLGTTNIGSYDVSLLFTCMFGTYGNGTILGITASTYQNTWSDGASISNNYWLTSSPFSSRYYDIKRIEKLNGNKFSYTSSCSFHVDPAGQRPWAGYSKIGKNFSTFFPSYEDLFWRTVVYFIPENSITVCYIVPNVMKVSPYYTLPATPNNSEACSMKNVIIVGNINGTVTGSNLDFLAPDLIHAYPPITWPSIGGSNQNLKTLGSNELAKRLYGFGNGPSSTPEFISIKSSSWHSYDRDVISDIPGVLVRYGTIIHGWKYGLLSGIPLFQKAVFNRNHFGFLRDMYEGPMNTRVANLENGSISSQINISFVVGSDDFVSAASPLTYNLRDSGIYTRDYTSGQPFADT